MNTVVVAVSCPGPPRVIAQMIGNELKTLITLMSAATRNAGRSSGSVIERYVRQVEAPSTRAASYSSVGIVCKPASNA